MKAFVTGIAGFLGSHLGKKLDCSGIDNLVGGANLHPKMVVGDILDYDLLVRSMDAEIVFHTACYPHEGLSVFSPTVITESVFMGTVNVVRAAVETGVKKIVFFSSMSRYGDHPKKPFTEDLIPEPVDPYGIAKVAAENVLKSLCEAHGLEYVILVPHNIYGPGQRYTDPFRNVAAIMANRILSGKPPIIYGDGKQTRCFSYIDDVTDWVIKLGMEETGIWNVGPDEEFTTIETLAKNLIEITGADFSPEYFPARPQEVKHAFCSSEKIKKKGFKQSTALYTGLENLVDWILKEGPKPFEYHLPVELNTPKVPKTWSQRLM